MQGEYTLYSEGQLKEKGTLINGRLEGKVLEYYRNGKLKEKIENNKPDGECNTYYENGKIKEKRLYLKGKLEGAYYYYYSSGNIWIENNYKWFIKRRKKSYYENGKSLKKEQFKNGFNISRSYIKKRI